MRLLHTKDFTFKEFIGENIPAYAIVSHRWSDEEVSHQDFLENRRSFLPRQRKGYGWIKIEKGCEIALSDGYDWLWIDTCCIDKKSSAELSEAINSMFQWYKNSKKCYVFLPDVHPTGKFNDPKTRAEFSVEEFKSSQWFTRAWTLQELIAPWEVLFFNSDFQLIGTKVELHDDVGKITGISQDILQEGRYVKYASVAARMRWASRRTSTKPEDMAYSLLGIFDINMPLLYGEGEKAFHRLQLEIIRQSDDESILVWPRNPSKVMEKGLLALDVSCFTEVADCVPFPLMEREHYEVTNKGVRIICHMPNALLDKFSRGEKRAALLLMPLNVIIRRSDPSRQRGVTPCLMFIASRSLPESGPMKYFTGQRTDLVEVTAPVPTRIPDIKNAAENIKDFADRAWVAFCGIADADHTAVPVYFPFRETYSHLRYSTD